MKVIIAYDGSESSEQAVADLARAGLPATGTQVRVITAWDLVLPPPPPDPPAGKVVFRDVQRLRSLAQESVDRAGQTPDGAAARIRQTFPEWSVSAEAPTDEVHWALVNGAAAWSADLVVVGSYGRSALGRLVLGSVSQQVLQHAPCSVRVARGPSEAARPRGPGVKLVLGFDGSLGAATAASAVSARHWPAGTEVSVVGVVDARVILDTLMLNPPAEGTRRDVPADAATALEASLSRVCDDLRRAGINATATCTAGDPKKVLLEEAERLGADCIFLGAKGHSRIERLLLGSVSASVAARAACSVEVVRTGA